MTRNYHSDLNVGMVNRPLFHFSQLLAFRGWYVTSIQFVKYVFTLMTVLVIDIPVIVLFTSDVTKVSLFRTFYGNFPDISKNLNDSV